MSGTGSIWALAGVTTAVGMGVVFAALFLLSVYMHYFKSLIGRFEGREKAQPEPRKPTAKPPALRPAPEAARGTAEGERVAAAAAVALHLGGMRVGVSGEIAAAIAVALAVHRRAKDVPGEVRSPAGADWRLAGRIEAMHGRLRRLERPLSPRRG